MQYQGSADFDHLQASRIGVLITNLGTPDAPDTRSLRRYLAEFLSDPRVVEVPRLIWWLVLHGIILRIRPRRSARAYASVWTDAGSPLLVHTRAQCEALGARLKAHWGDDLVVSFAMRYGAPSISDTLHSMEQAGVERLMVMPLYPQYSAATGGSTFDALAHDLMRRRRVPGLRFVDSYHDDPRYIDAMAKQIEAAWAEHGRPQKLLLSYHGVPLRYLHAGDPYHCQCLKTSRLLAERLGLGEEQCLTTFQSRFGREAWLQPYTDEVLKALPAEGVKDVQVFCPGFSADCLETLEEIGEENRHYFLDAGGGEYSYIPALNSEPEHIAALAQLVDQHLSGWLDGHSGFELRQQRARALGADD